LRRAHTLRSAGFGCSPGSQDVRLDTAVHLHLESATSLDRNLEHTLPPQRLAAWRRCPGSGLHTTSARRATSVLSERTTLSSIAVEVSFHSAECIDKLLSNREPLCPATETDQVNEDCQNRRGSPVGSRCFPRELQGTWTIMPSWRGYSRQKVQDSITVTVLLGLSLPSKTTKNAQGRSKPVAGSEHLCSRLQIVSHLRRDVKCLYSLM